MKKEINLKQNCFYILTAMALRLCTVIFSLTAMQSYNHAVLYTLLLFLCKTLSHGAKRLQEKKGLFVFQKTS